MNTIIQAYDEKKRRRLRMCGIAGFVGVTYDNGTVSRMLNSMKHRGPDENGMLILDDVCSLHQ